MTPTGSAIYKMVRQAYDLMKSEPKFKDRPDYALGNAVSLFLAQTFKERNINANASMVCWLLLAAKYPGVSGFIMENMDQQLVDLMTELCDAINEVYLEVR